jgi:cytochrome c biogenesis protein CcdA
MLPSYVAYYLNSMEEDSDGWRLGGALVFSSAMISGFLTVFIGMGFMPSLALGFLPISETVLIPIIGVCLLVIGLFTAASSIFQRVPQIHIVPPKSSGFVSSFIYGVAYALASLSCSLPVFLLVVLQSASSGGILEIFFLFLLYSLGASTLIFPITVATSFSRNFLHSKLLTSLPHVRKLNAFVLSASGAYMILLSLL